MDWVIKKSALYICDKWGNLGRQICESVSYADYSQRGFLVTKENGSVEIRDCNGNVTRRICQGAIEARFRDGGIMVRFKNETLLFDEWGNNIRRY